MANGLNKCTFIGNLGADPETKKVGEQNVTEFRLAVNESWTDKSGTKQERTEWVRCSVWGKRADVVAQYAKKGSKLYVEGRMQTREYEKDGEKRYATSINVSDFLFLGGGEGGKGKKSDSWDDVE